MATSGWHRKIGPVLFVLAILTACGANPPAGDGVANRPSTPSPQTEQPVPAQTEQPVPAENSPPGDIPDDTAFVPYRAAGGFRFTVPEGWARTTTTSGATFTDKLNTVAATWSPRSSAPTVGSARTTEVRELRSTERAFRLQDVTSVSLPGGRAVLITFRENSEPSPVTGKQYRLDVERFEFFRGGTEAVLTLSSPVGADNVDPWRIVSQSFAWA